ncbi:zinc finger protein [Trichonephila clavata]|uniref:Zinc finger protein n=1 Tax=Trichonephila clavata TaxID=2740835 RepID=A0A8X6G9B3_TRICU|nr:zinc finger protein [Trichonephila clavata]
MHYLKIVCDLLLSHGINQGIFLAQASHVKHLKANRLFPCDQCFYSAISKADLVKHYRKHTGERPHCCEFCGRRFSLKQNLRRHGSV